MLLPEVRQAIDAAGGRDPLEVALDSRIPHARSVATQVKYLERARHKLPTFAAARCILPPRAFEQASSEGCARCKRIEGDRVLDLTCGLGVDAWALSRRFRRVTALERDPVLAAVAAENFSRLGVANIEVVNSSAEEFLQREGLHFDWIYVDPDRRSADGRKLVRMEDCSPDVVALLPRLREAAPRLCVKNSPLFDVDEAFRRFGPCRVEVLSVGDGAFFGCSLLAAVTIPDNWSELPAFLFGNCTSLTKVQLPQGCTKIGEYAFVGCAVSRYPTAHCRRFCPNGSNRRAAVGSRCPMSPCARHGWPVCEWRARRTAGARTASASRPIRSTTRWCGCCPSNASNRSIRGG